VECDQEAATIKLDGGAVVPARFVGSVGLPWPKVVVAAAVEFDSDRRPVFLAQMVRSADGKPVAIRDVPWSEVLRRLVVSVTALYLIEVVRLADFPSLSDMQPVRETLRAAQTRRRLPSSVRAAERPPKPSHDDLRRLLNTHGRSTVAIVCQRYGCSRSTANRWLKPLRSNG
jgi:hypothetical protein